MIADTILQGDIRQIARTLPAQSVHTIVTSPPYYGLRDYGTAEWEGGREDCDHVEETGTTRGGPKSTITGGQDTKPHEHQYRNICPKCGAIRKDAQIGLEASPQEYVDELVGIFRELRRVLRDDGSVWLNLGDSYSQGGGAQVLQTKNASHGLEGIRGKTPDLPPKQLLGIPWRVALALQADGWYLRSDIIWAKANCMPESVTDRPTKAHEYIFLLSKSPRYYYDAEAVREPQVTQSLEEAITRAGAGGAQYDKWEDKNGFRGLGGLNRDTKTYNPAGRNRRTVWTVASKPYPHAHFATFPPDLIRPCILAGCPAKACADCGAPWERVVEKDKYNRKGDNIYGNGTIPNYHNPNGKVPGSNTRGMPDPNTKTIGFRPTCDCNAPTVPGVVFDPFLGSGTVAQVAIEEGRRWLGCELSPKYIDLAWKRIEAARLAKVAGKDYAKTVDEKIDEGWQQLGMIEALAAMGGLELSDQDKLEIMDELLDESGVYDDLGIGNDHE